MNIAVFGTGMVGQSIADKLHQLGHSVTIGTRDPKQTINRDVKDRMGVSFKEWYSFRSDRIKVATFTEAAMAAEIIFNCTAGNASVDVLQHAGENSLKGKILVDIANPLDFSKGMPPFLNPGNTDSLGELIQRTFPELKVVKTLNTMNCYLMVNPALVPGTHNVFMSGNDEASKGKVTALLQSFGWDRESIIDLGDITTARATEQLLPIWLRLWGKFETPMFNFQIVVAPPQ